MPGNVQFIKWSLPALALIFGYFWYRRRCVDRVDPGGKASRSSDSCGMNEASFESKKETPSRCDSGLPTDEPASLNSTESPIEELSISPRRVSSNLDIPVKRSSPQPIMKSGKFIDESRAWFDDEDNSLPEMKSIQLGSNPASSNFSMMTQKVSGLKAIPQEEMKIEPESMVENLEEAKDEEKKSEKSEEKKKVEGNEKTEEQGQVVVSERDSANHSPISGVLEGSLTDEVRSEGSTDSGKGGSIKGHKVNFTQTTYDFWVPQQLVGKLIGRQGACLANIRQKANVKINVKKQPAIKNFNICLIEGTSDNIQMALGLIRKVFPESKYPNMTLEQVTVPKVDEEVPWLTELMHLSLVEGMNNDVVVCHVVKPNRLFVQFPTHPTFPSLRYLDDNMMQTYQNTESPPVPMELRRGMIVAVKWYNKWVRAYVENPDPKGEETLVRLLDHGGYWAVEHLNMRKIRSDYLTLPFQAIEVFIGNVKPKNGEWQLEANDVVAHLCAGIVGQAQVVGYIDSNIYISLFFNIQKHGLISVADELISRGYAEHVSLEKTIPEQMWPSM